MGYRSQADFSEDNQLITKKYLEVQQEFTKTQTEDNIVTSAQTGDYIYYRIESVSAKWLFDEQPVWKLMSELFTGLHTVGAPASLLINSDGNKVNVYFGSQIDFLEITEGLLYSVFPQIGFEINKNSGGIVLSPYSEITKDFNYGGYVKGNPTGNESFQNVFQLDSIIKGMNKTPWEITLFAIPFSKKNAIAYKQKFLSAANWCSELEEVTVSGVGDAVETSFNSKLLHAQQYSKLIEDFCNQLDEGIAVGEWCVTYNFSSNSDLHSRLLGGISVAAFHGEESLPEPVHAVFAPKGCFCPIVNGMDYSHCVYDISERGFDEAMLRIIYPRYSTLLSSTELAVYSALPTVDTGGISVYDYVDFDVNRTAGGDVVIGSILDSGQLSRNMYEIDSNEFNRHCLVVGLTGSGKTNTVKSIINSVSKSRSLPVMIIEPAKKEYWELYKLGYDNLQIYSVGSNEKNSNILCINPFERSCYIAPDGTKKSVSIQTHIDFVYAAFKASFIMYTPMPYVLERAIYSIYEDCGWDIHNNVNKNGSDIYPTIEDLYYKIPEVVVQMGYDQRMRNDLIGSLQARINSMRIGAKGDALNVERSFPMHELLNGNIVVELEDIGDDDVKAFIISLLLVNLLEYRRQQEDSQLELRHLVLIEEAHRLLKNVQSGTGENADPRGAAVEFFCNLLAELRSKGQGFIVADQIPSKLAPDLIKNTNLKIVHRTVAEEERVLVGGAMHMTEEQIDSLSSLRQGVAAVYSEGDYRPKLVKSLYAGKYESEERKHLSRESVLEQTRRNCISTNGREEYVSLTDSPKAVCKQCKKTQCPKHYRDVIRKLDGENGWLDFAMSQHPERLGSCVPDNLYDAISDYLNQHSIYPQQIEREDINCAFACMIEAWNWKSNNRHRVIKVFTRIRR